MLLKFPQCLADPAMPRSAVALSKESSSVSVLLYIVKSHEACSE